MAIDYAAGGRLRKLRPEEAWKTIEDLAQYEEEEWNEPESPDYIDASLEQELESIEYRVKSLMRNEVLLEYEEDQVRKLEEDMRKTKDTFMCLADSLIATPKKNKLEYKDEDEVEIKMMGTGIDKDDGNRNG
ncbi:hypothetical protein Tco_0525450 [Tanacetum coccineum]